MCILKPIERPLSVTTSHSQAPAGWRILLIAADATLLMKRAFAPLRSRSSFCMHKAPRIIKPARGLVKDKIGTWQKGAVTEWESYYLKWKFKIYSKSSHNESSTMFCAQFYLICWLALKSTKRTDEYIEF